MIYRVERRAEILKLFLLFSTPFLYTSYPVYTYRSLRSKTRFGRSPRLNFQSSLFGIPSHRGLYSQYGIQNPDLGMQQALRLV